MSIEKAAVSGIIPWPGMVVSGVSSRGTAGEEDDDRGASADPGPGERGFEDQVRQEHGDTGQNTASGTFRSSSDERVAAVGKAGELEESDEVDIRGKGAGDGAVATGEALADDCGEDELWPATSVRQNKRPFRVLSPQLPSPEGMERLAMGGISDGSSDARVGAADQGGEIGERDESGRASGIRGENASDEAVAAGDMVAGDGGGGGTVSMGVKTKPIEWAKMSKSQRNRWSRRNKK
jgi:hypothetical protein